jgi:hypothetical protein
VYTEIITEKEIEMNKNTNPRISRNDAKGEWNTYLEDKTIYKWNEQLWTGRNYAQGNERGIELTPLTDQEREYLASRGVLSGLENY